MKREGRPPRRPTPQRNSPGVSVPTRSEQQLRYVRLGELHPSGRCASCGTSTGQLYRTRLVWTEAEAELCGDLAGCIRRTRRARGAL
jgi:hypothetical protein